MSEYKYIVKLSLTPLQQQTIKELFNHYDWDYDEAVREASAVTDLSPQDDNHDKLLQMAGDDTSAVTDLSPQDDNHDKLLQMAGDDTSAVTDLSPHDDNTTDVPQVEGAEVCPHCFLAPYITHDANRQMWWEVINNPPHPRNHKAWKKMFNFFWAMMDGQDA